jgi:hypothetical protein
VVFYTLADQLVFLQSADKNKNTVTNFPALRYRDSNTIMRGIIYFLATIILFFSQNSISLSEEIEIGFEQEITSSLPTSNQLTDKPAPTSQSSFTYIQPAILAKELFITLEVPPASLFLTTRILRI